MGEARVPLAELAERVRGLEADWDGLAEESDAGSREAVADDGVRMPAAVSIAQAIHHAKDQRNQILSILGAHSLEVPRLDIWAYASSHGQLRETQAPSAG